MTFRPPRSFGLLFLLALLCAGCLGVAGGQTLDRDLDVGELELGPDTGPAVIDVQPLPAAEAAALAAAPPNARVLPPAVLNALRRAGVPPSAMSALVVPVGGGAEQLRFQAEQPINPASVMKLVTTYAAVDLLGPEFTWSTRFLTDGVVSAGALRGNLYIQGSGDPKLVLERIQAAFQALQNQGVVVVLGDMVLDNSAFELPPRDPGAFDGEALRPYNASPDALLVNFKSVVLKFSPDRNAGVARVVSEPPMAGLAVDATLPLTKAACGDWRGMIRARFDDANAIRFDGFYPQSCGDREWPVAYQDPSSYAARALEGLWRGSGGVLTGRVRAGTTPPKARLLHEARSLPLSEIITDVNQWSNNVMAQQVFLTLGRLTPARLEPAKGPRPRLVPERTGGLERSREVLARWWRNSFGIRHSPPVMENGSGLSRIERITADSLAEMLRQAARHPRGDTFVQSLSVAGVKGTAARYGSSPLSPVHGNAWLKTGTLRDVTGVAGYVNAAQGRRYVVVGFINHPNAVAARPALDALLEWTASLR